MDEYIPEIIPYVPEIREEAVPSPQQVTDSINAAFDSVYLCNEIIAENEKTTRNISTVERNKSHLETMIGKFWFIEGLTEEQRASIDATISASYLFIS